MVPTSEKLFINKVKVWLFPSLITVLGWFLVTSITEMKSDIKTLLTQSSSDKATIQALTKQVDMLNQKVFTQSQDAPYQKSDTSVFVPAIAYITRDEEDKKEKLKKI
jgi:hypothetical protein